MPYSYSDEIDKLTNEILGIETTRRSSPKKPEYAPQGDYEVIDKVPTANQQYKTLQSDEYKAKRKYERKYGNVVTTDPYGEVGTTQYTNPNKLEDTGPIEHYLNVLDDAVDPVVEAIFGKPDDKTKADSQAILDDNNIEVVDGKAYYTKTTNFNSRDITEFSQEVTSLQDEEDARDVLYYDRVDNIDGTVSYKIGVTNIDSYTRYRESKRSSDVTNLWSVRTSKAKEYEALAHGNEYLRSKRRFDLGQDKEKFGSGYTEIYNEDFLGLDGTITADKLRSMNISSQQKLAELGFNVQGRYDDKGNELAYKELDKLERIYGKDSQEYKEFARTLDDVNQIGRMEDKTTLQGASDLIDAGQSSLASTAAGIGDFVLDAAVEGDSTLLNKYKDTAYTDKVFGYEGRKETSIAGREALRLWDKGNYLGAVAKGLTVAPNVVAESSGDMALLAVGGAEVKLAEGVGKAFKTLMNPKLNKGLTTFAAKQTNNQIDERMQNDNGEEVDYGTIISMFGSNYALGSLDRFALKGQLGTTKGLDNALDILTPNQMDGFAQKASKTLGDLVVHGSTEAAQEFVQSYGETINAGLGTDKYGNDPFASHYLDEATVGALLGFGAGSTIRAGGKTLNQGKKAYDKGKETYESSKKPIDEAITNQENLDTKTVETVQEGLDAVLDLQKNDETRNISKEIDALAKLQPYLKNNDDAHKKYNEALYSVTKHFEEAGVVTQEDTTLGSREVVASILTRAKDNDTIKDKNMQDNIRQLAKNSGIDDVAFNYVLEGLTAGQEAAQLGVDKSVTRNTETVLKGLSTTDQTLVDKGVSDLIGFKESQQLKIKEFNKAIDEATSTGNRVEFTYPSTRGTGNMLNGFVEPAGVDKAVDIVNLAETSIKRIDAIVDFANGTSTNGNKTKTETNSENLVLTNADEGISLYAQTKEDLVGLKTQPKTKSSVNTKVDAKSVDTLAVPKRVQQQLTYKNGNKPNSKHLFRLASYVQKPTNRLQTGTMASTTTPSDQKIIKELTNKARASGSKLFHNDLSSLNNSDVSDLMTEVLVYKDDNGNLQQDHVVLASMQARAMGAALNNTSFLSPYKTREDVASMLGKKEEEVTIEDMNTWSNKGMFASNFVSLLGANILKDVGITPRKNATGVKDFASLETVIGSGAMAMLVDQGVLTLDATNTTVNGKEVEVKTVRFAKDFLLKDLKEFIRSVKSYSDVFGIDTKHDENLPHTEPVKDKKYGDMRVKNSPTNSKVSKEKVDTINKLTKVEWTINDNVHELLLNHKDVIKKYLEYENNVSNNKLSYTKRVEAMGKNKTIDDTFAFLEHENGVAEDYYNTSSNRMSFYFDYFIGRNLRMYMKSSKFNPQTNTLLRFLVQPVDTTETKIDKNNVDDMNAFKYAIVQGFGHDVDKYGANTEQIDKWFKGYTDKGYDSLMAEFLDGNAKDKISSKGVGHYINALHALESYEKGSDVFTTSVLAEIDHKTSGFAIKQLQYPLLSDDDLKQVGIVKWHTDENVIDRNIDDAYEKNGKDIFTQEAVDKANSRLIKDMDKYGLLPKVNKDGTVPSSVRSIMKPIFMVFNYSAGISKLKGMLSTNIVENMINSIVAEPTEYDEILTKLTSITKTNDLLSELRNKPLDSIKLKNGGNLLKFLKQEIDTTYGTVLATTIKKNYEDFMTVNKLVIDMFNDLNSKFLKEYNRWYKETNPTKVQIEAWLDKNRSKIPHIKTPDGGVLELVSTDKVNVEGTHQLQFKGSLLPVGGKKQKTIKLTPQVRTFGELSASGAVIPIQAIDAANLAYTLNEFPELNGVFDALVGGPLSLKDVAHYENKKLYDINKRYSITEELIAQGAIVPKDYTEFVQRISEVRDEFYSQPVTIENIVLNNEGAYKTETKAKDTLGSRPETVDLVKEHKKTEELVEAKKWDKLEKLIDSLHEANNRDLTDIITNVYGNWKGLREELFTVTKSTQTPEGITLVMNKDGVHTTITLGVDETVATAKTGIKFVLSEPLSKSHEVYDIDDTYLGSRLDEEESTTRATKLKDLSTNNETMLSMLDELNEEIDDKLTEDELESLKEVLSTFGTNYMNKTELAIAEIDVEAKGMFNTAMDKITIYKSKLENNIDRQNLPAIYAHEVIHALTEFGLKEDNFRVKDIKRKLGQVYREALKVVTVEDFINDRVAAVDPDKAFEQAQQDYTYVFKNTDKMQGLNEFIAFGLTHPKVSAKLKSVKLGKEDTNDLTLFHKMIRYLRDFFSTVFGDKAFNSYNRSIHQNLLNLAVSLNKSNNKAINATQKSKSLARRLIFDTPNDALAGMVAGLGELLGANKRLDTLPKNATKGQMVVWILKNVPKFLRSENAGSLSTMLHLLGFNANGDVQSVIRKMTTPAKYSEERQLGKIASLRGIVDEEQENSKNTITTMLRDLSGKLSEDQERHLLDGVLKVDLVSLQGRYSNDEIIELLNNEQKVKDEVKLHEDSITAEVGTNKHWVLDTTKELGYYMVTGKISAIGEVNAHNIFTGRQLKKGGLQVAKKDITEDIDRLATLYALQYLDSNTKTSAASTLGNTEFIEALFATASTMKKESLKFNFDNDKTLMHKGYVVDLNDSSLDVRIELLSKEDEMAEEGYELKVIPNNSNVGVYISEDYTQTNYVSSAVAMGNLVSKGTTTSKILSIENKSKDGGFETELSKLELDRKALLTERLKGKGKKPEDRTLDDVNILPLFNSAGKVVDFRYLMSTNTKRKLLNPDTRYSEVIGMSYAKVGTKLRRKEHNKQVIEMLNYHESVNNPEDLTLGNNNYIYVKIGHSENSDIFLTLPYEIQEYIMSRPKGYVSVRADLVDVYFGYKAKSVMDSKFMKTLTSREARRKLKKLSKVWENIISIYKNEVVAKTLNVLGANVVSNTAQLVQRGENPVKATERTVRVSLRVVEHMKLKKELKTLRLKEKIGTISHKEKFKIKTLEDAISREPDIERLIKIGHFSNIIEEVDINKNKKDKNIVRAEASKRLNKLPKGLITAVEELYATKNTESYKVLEEVLHYSDFIARVALDEKLKEDGVSVEDRDVQLADAFVNYNIVHGRIMEWVDRKGLILFPKYFIGSQRTIRYLMTDKPLYALMSLLGQHWILDVEDVMEGNLLNKGYSRMVLDPLEVISTILTPASIRNLL